MTLFRTITAALLLMLVISAPLHGRAQNFADVVVGSLDDDDTSSGSSVPDPSDILGEGGLGSGFINQYSDQYKPFTKEDLANIRSKDILGTPSFNIQLARHPDDAYGTVNLRLQSPLNIQGCGTGQIPYVEVERSGRVIEISLGKPELLSGSGKRYPHYECRVNEATPSIDIPLNRNDLLAHRVNEIKLKVDSAGSDALDVIVGENDLILSSKTAHTFKPNGKEGGDLRHVFYPVNMVILSAPTAHKDKNLLYKIEMIAKKHKLTPIDTPIPNAKPYEFYALDKDYNVMLPLQRRGITKLGTITVDDVLYGVNGAYTVPRKADVFVKLPSEFD